MGFKRPKIRSPTCSIIPWIINVTNLLFAFTKLFCAFKSLLKLGIFMFLFTTTRVHSRTRFSIISRGVLIFFSFTACAHHCSPKKKRDVKYRFTYSGFKFKLNMLTIQEHYRKTRTGKSHWFFHQERHKKVIWISPKSKNTMHRCSQSNLRRYSKGLKG